MERIASAIHGRSSVVITTAKSNDWGPFSGPKRRSTGVRVGWGGATGDGCLPSCAVGRHRSERRAIEMSKGRRRRLRKSTIFRLFNRVNRYLSQWKCKPISYLQVCFLSTNREYQLGVARFQPIFPRCHPPLRSFVNDKASFFPHGNVLAQCFCLERHEAVLKWLDRPWILGQIFCVWTILAADDR